MKIREWKPTKGNALALQTLLAALTGENCPRCENDDFCGCKLCDNPYGWEEFRRWRDLQPRAVLVPVTPAMRRQLEPLGFQWGSENPAAWAINRLVELRTGGGAV